MGKSQAPLEKGGLGLGIISLNQRNISLIIDGLEIFKYEGSVSYAGKLQGRCRL